MIHYADDTVTLHAGDSLEIARELPDQSVQTIVTSPPYFGLRDYGTDGQFGAEASVDEYVGNLVALFSELHRVLANDGTAWINLGDSYSGSRGGPQGASAALQDRAFADHRQGVQTRNVEGLGKKNLIGVPWRVAFALQADGWILRKDVIWHKPNAMPESVTDRPTSAHEHIFFLSKSVNYYYDADAVRSVKSKGHTPGRTWEERKAAGAPSRHSLDGARESGFGTAAGSNLREPFDWKPTDRKHEVNDRLRIRGVREAMRPDSWLWAELDKWFSEPASPRAEGRPESEGGVGS